MLDAIDTMRFNKKFKRDIGQLKYYRLALLARLAGVRVYSNFTTRIETVDADKEQSIQYCRIKIIVGPQSLVTNMEAALRYISDW